MAKESQPNGQGIRPERRSLRQVVRETAHRVGDKAHAAADKVTDIALSFSNPVTDIALGKPHTGRRRGTLVGAALLAPVLAASACTSASSGSGAEPEPTGTHASGSQPRTEAPSSLPGDVPVVTLDELTHDAAKYYSTGQQLIVLIPPGQISPAKDSATSDYAIAYRTHAGQRGVADGLFAGTADAANTASLGLVVPDQTNGVIDPRGGQAASTVYNGELIHRRMAVVATIVQATDPAFAARLRGAKDAGAYVIDVSAAALFPASTQQTPNVT